jgi:hypothetical protein
MVLKGGVSLKIARFLSNFCPYRGANTAKYGSELSQQLCFQLYFQGSSVQNFCKNDGCNSGA